MISDNKEVLIAFHEKDIESEDESKRSIELQRSGPTTAH